MAKDGDSGKPEERRHVWGPRAVGALVPALTRPAFRHRSPAAAQLLTDWTTIVGPALAAVTRPRRLSGATLTIACSGPIALELQHMSGELIGRINAHSGRASVQRLRFVQEALAGPLMAAEPVTEEALVPVEGVKPGPLNDALARLGRAVRKAGPRA